MYDLPSQLENVSYDRDGRPMVDASEFSRFVDV